MMLRETLLLLTCVALAPGCSEASADIVPDLKTNDEWQIWLSGGGVVEAGMPVLISATYQNISRTKIKFYESNFWYTFNVTVLDADGRPVPVTHVGEMIAARKKWAPAVRRRYDMLPDHSAFWRDEVLGLMYDLSMPGKYTVVASDRRLNRACTGILTIVSNTLPIEIVEEPDVENSRLQTADSLYEGPEAGH